MASESASENLPAPMRRLVFVVTEDWFFASHFLPMARAAQAAGFEVHVATPVSVCSERDVKGHYARQRTGAR